MTRRDLSPVVKWVGGKRQLLPVIRDLLPSIRGSVTYFEPFLGGASVALSLCPDRAVLNDVNPELITLYQVVRDSPGELLELVKSYPNNSDFYYELWALDRDAEAFNALSAVERAARMLFLNRAGFNGLYRVNAGGEFNVPFGKQKQLSFDESNLYAVSKYLQQPGVEIANGDYKTVVESVQPGDFVYFDPPYDPVSGTADFTSYSAAGFTRENQVELFEFCKDLDRCGVNFMLSNSGTDFILDLYGEFTVRVVSVKRLLSASVSGRGVISEVIVTNYAASNFLDFGSW